MIDSLFIGETGMAAQQRLIDTISNNLANINTSGFKKSRVNFEDVLYRNINNSPLVNQALTSSGFIGSGVDVSSTSKVFTNGNLQTTSSQFDLAINGNGFFEVILENGDTAYTRNGAFQLNSDGFFTTSNGQILSDLIQLPVDSTDLIVEQNGDVSVVVPDEAEVVPIGQIKLVQFLNPQALDPIGNNLFTTTETSGDAIGGDPGENGLGTVEQGFLESANVELTEEIINLVLAQQAFQMNSRVVQASDRMLSITNELFT